MIELDMRTKLDKVVSIKTYHLEHNIITLQVKLLNYDLAGKAVKAIFEPKEIVADVEVDEQENILKVQIKREMMIDGLNYLQFNFLWDDKLEQSSIITWRISKSL